jgi:hypothetical protein
MGGDLSLLSRAHLGKVCLYRLGRVHFVITTSQTVRKTKTIYKHLGLGLRVIDIMSA